MWTFISSFTRLYSVNLYTFSFDHNITLIVHTSLLYAGKIDFYWFWIRRHLQSLSILSEDMLSMQRQSVPNVCQRKGCWITHWGRVTHICASKLTIIGSDNGLSPERHQAMIRTTSAWILLIRPLETNFSEIVIEIHIFSFTKSHFKTSSAI